VSKGLAEVTAVK